MLVDPFVIQRANGMRTCRLGQLDLFCLTEGRWYQKGDHNNPEQKVEHLNFIKFMTSTRMCGLGGMLRSRVQRQDWLAMLKAQVPFSMLGLLGQLCSER